MTRSVRMLVAAVLTTAALMRLGAAVIDVVTHGGTQVRALAGFFSVVAVSASTPALAILAAALLRADRVNVGDDAARVVQLMAVVGCGAVTCVLTLAYAVAYVRSAAATVLTIELSLVLVLFLAGVAAVIAGLAELHTHPTTIDPAATGQRNV